MKCQGSMYPLAVFNVDAIEHLPHDYELSEIYHHPNPTFVYKFLLDHAMIKATNPTVTTIHDNCTFTEKSQSGKWIWSDYGISVPILRQYGLSMTIGSTTPVITYLPAERSVPTIFYQSTTLFGSKVTHRFECHRLSEGDVTSNEGKTQVKLSSWIESPLWVLKKFILNADHDAQISTLKTGSRLIQSYELSTE